MASLKLRVSRLEATLRAKEAELARLQASAKATALNEMKIEAETYYQEVRAESGVDFGLSFFFKFYSNQVFLCLFCG